MSYLHRASSNARSNPCRGAIAGCIGVRASQESPVDEVCPDVHARRAVMHQRFLVRFTRSMALALVLVVFVAGAAAAQTLAYVTDSSTNTVYAIDTATNTVVASVPVGNGASSVAATPGGAFVYVVNTNDDTVSVIRVATNAVVATVPVGDRPAGIAITPNGAFAYVINNDPIGNDTVSVIDTATNTVAATVPLPLASEPNGIVITPNGAFAYVANFGGSSFSVIDTATNTVVANIPVPANPTGLAVTPDGAFVYSATLNSGDVLVISTATNSMVATIPAGDAFGLAITPDGSSVYLPRIVLDVAVIDTATNTEAAAVAVGGNPVFDAVTPDGAFVYVTNCDGAVEVRHVDKGTVRSDGVENRISSHGYRRRLGVGRRVDHRHVEDDSWQVDGAAVRRDGEPECIAGGDRGHHGIGRRTDDQDVPGIQSCAIDERAVRSHGQAGRVCRDRDVGDHGVRRRVDDGKAAASKIRHIGECAVGRDHDPVGLGRQRQGHGGRDRVRRRVDHRDGVVADGIVVDDISECTVGRDGDPRGPVSHGHSRHDRVRGDADHRHRVVIRVHHIYERAAGSGGNAARPVSHRHRRHDRVRGRVDGVDGVGRAIRDIGQRLRRGRAGDEYDQDQYQSHGTGEADEKPLMHDCPPCMYVRTHFVHRTLLGCSDTNASGNGASAGVRPCVGRRTMKIAHIRLDGSKKERKLS